MKTIKTIASQLVLVLLIAGFSSCKNGSAFKVGDHVAAKWTDGNYWLATISAMNGDKISVAYDDGDKGDVAPADIKTLCMQADLKAGDKVFASWSSSVKLYSGVIQDLKPEGATVKWDDGSEPSVSPYGKIAK